MSRPAARHLRAVDVPSREDLALVRGDLLSLKEVGELIGLRSRSAVIELLRKKRVRIVTLTRAWRVPRAELERVLAEHLSPGGCQ